MVLKELMCLLRDVTGLLYAEAGLVQVGGLWMQPGCTNRTAGGERMCGFEAERGMMRHAGRQPICV